jgi:hypothetical protein
MKKARRISTATKACLALVVLAVSAGAAAAAFGGSGDHRTQSLRERIQERRKSLFPAHIDLAAFASSPALPTDPVQRAAELRKIVWTLAANDAITVAQAQRALREIRETGTIGGRTSQPLRLPVRSLSTLPPQAHIPAEVARFVAYIGKLTHSGPADPASVRLLRSNLGTSHTDVYGARSAAGSPCFFATGYGGNCAASEAAVESGVSWIIGGAHDAAPSVFVGLAGDDVRSVQLTVDGVDVPVSLVSNVAFAEFSPSAQTAVITTTRTNGRTHTAGISLTG